MCGIETFDVLYCGAIKWIYKLAQPEVLGGSRHRFRLKSIELLFISVFKSSDSSFSTIICLLSSADRIVSRKMLLANYGSDSGSDSESEALVAPPPKPTPISAASSSSRVPQPKKKKPVKITLDLPRASNGSEDDKENGDNEEGSGDEREAKRTKLPKGGKGTSSLLGMLPPPKRKLPQSSATGTKATRLTVNKAMARSQLPAPPKATDEDSDDEDNVPKVHDLLPASLARKQQKVESKKEVIDVFGLSKLRLFYHKRAILILESRYGCSTVQIDDRHSFSQTTIHFLCTCRP